MAYQHQGPRSQRYQRNKHSRRKGGKTYRQQSRSYHDYGRRRNACLHDLFVQRAIKLAPLHPQESSEKSPHRRANPRNNAVGRKQKCERGKGNANGSNVEPCGMKPLFSARAYCEHEKSSSRSSQGDKPRYPASIAVVRRKYRRAEPQTVDPRPQKPQAQITKLHRLCEPI